MKKIYLLLSATLLLSFLPGQSQTVTWTPLTSGTTTNIVGVSAPSSSVCFVCGASGIIRKTIDGGANWTAQSSGHSQTLYSIVFTDLYTGYAVGDLGTAVFTTNGGTTWSNLPGISTTAGFRCVYFFYGSTGYITGGAASGTTGAPGQIFKTTNAGTTWTSLNTSGSSTNGIYSIYFTSATVGYALDYDGNVLKTINGGTAWTSVSCGVAGMNGSVVFNTTTTGFAGGLNGNLFETTNSGASWSAISSGTSTAVIASMEFYDANHGFAVGGEVGANTGYIISTTDGGSNWTSYIPGTQRLSKLDLVDANTGYAVGLGGVILKYGSNVGITENEKGFISFKNYPNPFTASTIIDCSNYIFKETASVEVYDITGKIVKSIRSTVKGNNITIEKNELTEGLYFYKVYDGETMIGTGKMIIQ